MRVLNHKRVGVWQQQPEGFLAHAIIEADGTLVGTTGECKGGMDLSYNGVWGYHPLLVSLANTNEPLFLVNRPASRPSYEGAAEYFDRAATLCRQAGFRQITFRGDTDFTQAAHLDRWDQEDGIHFVFGIDAQPNLVAIAERLPERIWQLLPRPARHEVANKVPRTRPANVKQAVVLKKGYTDVRLQSEQVAEFNMPPAGGVPPGLPGGGPAQASGHREEGGEGRRGGALLLLHNQPVGLGAGGGGLLRQ